MAAIAVSADGEYIFVALENASGQPVIAKAARDDPETWSAAYNPGAGSAGNVAQVPSDPDLMLFYGNFGSGAQVIEHAIAAVSNTNISPTGLTTKIANCLAVYPADANEIIITVNTDQDMLRTTDGGDNWETLNSALGFDPTALVAFFDERVFVAGDAGASRELLYSPNNGSSTSDTAGAALGAAAAICGLEAGYT